MIQFSRQVRAVHLPEYHRCTEFPITTGEVYRCIVTGVLPPNRDAEINSSIEVQDRCTQCQEIVRRTKPIVGSIENVLDEIFKAWEEHAITSQEEFDQRIAEALRPYGSRWISNVG